MTVTVLTIASWLLVPTLLGVAVMEAPRALRLVCDRLAERKRRDEAPVTVARPIEDVAERLRRLLAEHGRLLEAPAAIHPEARLRAVEAAIAGCALDAGTALGVPTPHPGAPESMPIEHLGRLLRSLAAAGIVLPASSDLLLAGLSG